MKMNNISIVSVTVLGAIGSASQAQELFPNATLNGVGATQAAIAQRQAFDCYGQKSVLAFQGQTSPLLNVPDFDYNPVATDTLGNRFNCAGNAAAPPISPTTTGSPSLGAARIVQPNVLVRYIATGSGDGINSWLLHVSPENNMLSNPAPRLPAGWASFGNAGVQFALSETALSFTDINSGTVGYNNRVLTTPDNNGAPLPPGTALARYGSAIQIPMFIAPVAIAFSPVYAKTREADNRITAYRFTIGNASADGSGGLRLTRAQYCGIFTGVITNWNQLPTTVINKDPNDPAPFNLPLQLVGRSDSSGTTALFTRALSAQCNSVSVNTGVGGVAPSVTISAIYGPSPTNWYGNATTTIPAVYRTGNAAFNKGPSPAITGTPVPGNYMLTNGDDGVAQAIDFHADPPSGSFATPTGRTLNGKIGYVGSDYVLPTTLYNGANAYGLNTARLQQGGAGYTYLAPTAKNATVAFGAVDPPQSTGTGGAYCETGSCNATVVSGGGGFGNRGNPLDWVYPANRFLVNTVTGATTTTPNPIAAPSTGYPIVGTINVLLYTCYFSPATRIAINGLWATYFGGTTKDYNNQAMPAALINHQPFQNVWLVNSASIEARSGLAPMPSGWQFAIRNTFFQNSTQTAAGTGVSLGSRNLWIQSRIPSLPSTTSTTNNTLQNSTPNPTCAGRPGA